MNTLGILANPHSFTTHSDHTKNRAKTIIVPVRAPNLIQPPHTYIFFHLLQPPQRYHLHTFINSKCINKRNRGELKMHFYYHYFLYLKTVLSKPGSIMLLCSELSRFLSTRMSPSLCAWSIFYMTCRLDVPH